MLLRWLTDYITVKITIIGIVILGISLGCSSWLVYGNFKKDLQNSTLKELTGIAITTSSQIPLEDLETIIDEEIDNTDNKMSYLKIREVLSTIRQENKINRSMCILKKTPSFENDSLLEIVIQSEKDSSSFNTRGTKVKANPTMVQVFSESRAFPTTIEKEQDQYWTSSIAPILDEDSDVIAVLVIEKNLHDYKSSLNRTKKAILTISALSLLLGCICLFLFNQPLVRRIHNLSTGAEIIAKGNLKHQIKIYGSDELTKLAVTLNQMTEHLTNEIDNNREAKKVAEQANLAKSEFLANMSHEIRTPINGIMGFNEMLRQTKLSVDQKEFVETVYRCSESLLGIINDILDISKLEAGQVFIEHIPINLHALLYDSCEFVQSKTTDKPVELLVDTNHIHPYLYGDPSHIRQILVNLIGNAIKFTKEGHVLVRLEPLEETESDIHVRVSVIDTGIGIAKDKQSLIFESFKQVDGSVTREYGGTGLGLSISQKLLHAMGSDLCVDSEEGKGSAFYFDIFFKKAKIPQDYHIHNHIKEELAGLPVVLVSDQGLSSSLFMNTLIETGLSPIHLKTSSATLSYLKENPHINFVAIDMDSKKMDPIAIQQRIFDEVGNHLRITPLTTDIRPETLKKYKDLKFTAYLFKPTRPSSVVSLLHDFYQSMDDIENFLTDEQEDDRIKGKILLVEDNPINQKLAMKMLTKLGHDVSLAENGQKAVNMTDKEKFDLIFMDMQMPVLNGIEATQHIRAKGNSIPIIALTANAFDTDRETCMKVGMNDFIPKPIKQEVLEKVLNYFLEQIQDK